MKQQINALTATRAFAAIMVYIFHFGRFLFPFDLAPTIFMDGNIAVNYFYVLSGFVLFISYSGRNVRYWDYFKKRLARIAPAYMLGLILFLFVYFFIYKAATSPDFYLQILYSVFFVQAYIPEYALVLNVAGWSISVEMFFYLLFPLMLFFQEKSNKWFVFFTVVVFVATQVACHFFYKRDYTLIGNFNFFMYHPFIHFSQFLVGMVGGYIFKHTSRVRGRFSYIPFVLLCVILFCMAHRPANLFFEAGLFAPLFMLFIISTAIDNPKFLNFKPLVFLGEISYGMYILQFPIYYFLTVLNNDILKLSPGYFFFISLVGLVLAATLSYYFVEKPIRNLINRVGKNQHP